MPLLEISASEALARARSDTYKTAWPDHTFPAARQDGVVEVFCDPSFQIRPDDRIFTIGSCFARNIEKRLREIGLDTVFYDEALSAGLAALGEGQPFTNKYNVSAIRHELEWACTGKAPPEAHVLAPTGKGMALDLFFNPRRKTGAPIEDARRRRALVAERFARIEECRVVVITLGLAEVWRDKASGLRLNVAPLGALRNEPERFVVEVLAYEDIVQDLEAIHGLLASRCPKDFRILITVSPVPLLNTFRGGDVMTANAYSKSVQRAAVEAFALKHDNVDYFPSYETVTLTDRRLAFESDNRHVQPGVVDRIVDRFVAAYIPELRFEQTAVQVAPSAPKVETAEDLLRSAKMHSRRGLESEAAERYERLIELHGDRLELIPTSHLRLKYGTSLLRSGRTAEGLRQIELAAEAPDADADLQLKCVDRLLAQSDFEGAARLLAAVGEGAEPQARAARAQRIQEGLQTTSLG